MIKKKLHFNYIYCFHDIVGQKKVENFRTLRLWFLSMSLVWTFTVIVPFINGSAYYNDSCRLTGINGVPPQCRSHTYFEGMIFDGDGVSENKKFIAVFQCLI